MSVRKVHTDIDGAEYWYDSSTRCWWGMAVDDDGYQMGDAVHAYTRREIRDECTGRRAMLESHLAMKLAGLL